MFIFSVSYLKSLVETEIAGQNQSFNLFSNILATNKYKIAVPLVLALECTGVREVRLQVCLRLSKTTVR